jgi:hypothetical protein
MSWWNVKIYARISFLSDFLSKQFHNTLWLAIIKARRIRYIGVRQELLKISIVGSRGMKRTWNQPTGYPQDPNPTELQR